MSLDGNIGYFMIQAEQQKYRPRYAINTFMGPTSVQVAVAPAAQLKGAVGVGWSPVTDVDAAHDDFYNHARIACDAYVRKSGQDFTGKRSAQFAAASLCDAFEILIQGAKGAGSIDPAAVRDLRYDTACSCFVYSSKTLFR